MGGIYLGGGRKEVKGDGWMEEWAIACINSTPDEDFVYVS